MATLANVTLTNTFDEWRTRTNQIIYKLDEFEIGNTIYLASNSANALLVSGTANLGANVFFIIRTSNNINDTANANIASMFAANQAHKVAWTAFDSSNGVNTWNYTYAANTVLLAANSAFAAANSNYTYAANTVMLVANSAYAAANAGASGAAAYDKANSANVLAFSAFVKANTTYTYAANNAMLAANSAFAKANAACTSAAAASTAAGAAYGKANSANIIAAAAFIQANTAPSEGVANNYEFTLGTSTDHYLSPDSVWMNHSVLTDATIIAVDFSKGFNFGGSGNLPLALGGNRTLGNPTNVKNGQSGVLWFTASGSTRTLTLGSSWWLCDGVETDAYSIAVGALLGVAYVVMGSYIYVTGIIRRDDYDAE